MPLTPDWLEDFYRRVGESASEVDLLLLEHVRSWMEGLWEKGALHVDAFRDFHNAALPLFENVEREDAESGPPTKRQRAILELLNFLRSCDMSRLQP